MRLGGNADFMIHQLQPESNGSEFKGVWSVPKGAFRFTTSKLAARRKRDISITVGIATIGIRGTDIWGKSNDEQDLVCLIEGKIDITRGSDAPVRMADPLSVYTAPRKAPANPLGTVAVPKLNKWAAETELEAGRGVLKSDGAYRVILLSSKQLKYAKSKSKQFNLAGYPAKVVKHDLEGVTWHQVGVENFAGLENAKAFANQIEGVFGTKGAWVNKN